MNFITGLKADWAAFEGWVAKWWPGLKTKIVAALGAIGSAAALGQDYLTQLTGLPNNVITGTKLSIFTLVCFTLAFWFRGMGDRVAARNVVSPA